jgi:hypothetical protein
LVAGVSNVIAIAAGNAHTIALTSDKRVWTFGDNGFGELGRNTGTLTYDPSPQPVTGLSNIVAIAGGYNFTVAVTSNGSAYGWGYSYYGNLGTNAGGAAITNPVRVAGISNVVWVSAHPDGNHVLAVTASGGTNQYWAYGKDDYGQVGNGTDNVNAVYTPVPLNFCPCGGCIQLGTNGTFTAPCTGTLFLFFNDDNFPDNSGAYTATVYGVASDVVVPANNNLGVVAGMVSNGVTYSYSATGFCVWSTSCHTSPDCATDANGHHPDGTVADCVAAGWNASNTAICPNAQCFSLVGKIEQ